MKSLNNILIIALFVAIVPLYVLHFTSAKTKDKPATETETSAKDFSGEIPIAYINIDSALVRMEMYTDLQLELSTKQQQLESSFAGKYKTFEQSVSRYQTDVSKGLLTRSEMQEKEQQLNNERINLESLQNEYMSQMQEQGLVSNRKVIDYIMEYLKEYNQEKGLQYIFSFSFGSNLLYVNNELDITNEVVEGLNTKYKTEKVTKK
jgi:outer membrane protein